jgi:sugar lactone lactonase YvrE
MIATLSSSNRDTLALSVRFSTQRHAAAGVSKGVTWGLSLLLAAPPLAAQITVDTFAGGAILTGVPAQNVALAQVNSMTWDANGGLVFCDRSSNLIRRIRADGLIETVAGSGVTGFSGDGGPALSAALDLPASPRYDARGNLYFADVGNSRIRRIDPGGVITSIAGDGVPLQTGMDLDGPALQRSLGTVADLAGDPAGNVYFIETGGSQVRRVTPAGQIEVFGAVRATLPSFLAADSAGSIYVVEGALSAGVGIRRFAPDGTSTEFAGYGQPPPNPVNNDGQPALSIFLFQIEVSVPSTRNQIGTRIRVIDASGIINTIAGGQLGQTSPDGPALPAAIAPAGLAADSRGNVAFADSPNGVDGSLIREVTAQASLVTLGGAMPQPAPDGTAAKSAWFISPAAIAFDHEGKLLIAETGPCLIRRIGSDGLLATAAGTGKCGVAHPAQPATGPDLPPPSGIAVDSQNRIYLLDTFGNSYVITPDGKYTPTGFAPTLGLGQITIDSKDRIYLLSLFGLNRFTSDGKQQTIVGPPSQPGVPPPGFGPTSMRALGVDPSGTVYFTGTYLGSPTDYVFRVHDDGTIAQVFGSAAAPLHLLNCFRWPSMPQAPPGW